MACEHHSTPHRLTVSAGCIGQAGRVDTYSATEAARVLGVSPKRVRQLVAQGKLDAAATDPLKLSQQQVNELREQRKGDSRAKHPAQPDPAAVGDLGALVEKLLTMQAQVTRLEIESQAAADLKLERDTYAARVMQLEAQLEQMRPRRRWRK